MARKNRRLSSASVYRYYAKRFTMNLGTLAHTAGKEMAMNPEVVKTIARLSYDETYNWLTDYQPSHIAKEVVKSIAEKYFIPTTYQGLLMAYAEKVLANYILDYKGEPLTEMHHNFLWTLMLKSAPGTLTTSGGFVFTFLDKAGHPHVVDMSLVLTEIEKELMKRAGK
ncbi:virion structural protein [Betalipothrixvirus uzonense]|uniref:Viral structural protein n=1 Tax=Betalipothrixvirus uzonense TaxID=512792 RepID=B2CRK9_9VIRU|nr:virion structural protein [Acidianus filamentous virus 9]ACB37266.1 viral structural protein [Acidianus filamentous virus 9]